MQDIEEIKFTTITKADNGEDSKNKNIKNIILIKLYIY